MKLINTVGVNVKKQNTHGKVRHVPCEVGVGKPIQAHEKPTVFGHGSTTFAGSMNVTPGLKPMNGQLGSQMAPFTPKSPQPGRSSYQMQSMNHRQIEQPDIMEK